MEFVPLWTDILDGPSWKIIDLPAEVYRFWTFCLLSAQKHDFADGYLPDLRTLSHWCQMDRDICVTLRDRLVELGLIDRVTHEGQDRDTSVTSAGQDRDMSVTVTKESQNGPFFRVHDWDDWRAVKDPGAKERKRKQRMKAKGLRDESRNGHGEVTGQSQDVTPQHSAFSIQNSEENSIKTTTPLPPTGGKDVSSSIEKDPPEYPDPLTSMHIIMTGEHRIEELEAREIWGAIWRQWKSSKLCYEFYEHQQWLTVEEWHYAIKTAITQNARPGSIRYLETIGFDAEENGEKQSTKPVKRAEIGQVPYKPAPVKATPHPKVSDPGPSIPADEAYRIMTGKTRGAN